MTTYKTLSKIAKGKYTLPILNTVRVQNGRVVANDLDLSIEDDAPANLKDGLYHGHGFDQGMYSDAGRDIPDFPETPHLGDELGNINVQAPFILDAMQWVSKAMSPARVRYYLNGICFINPAIGETGIVATDGNRMHIGKFAAPWPMQGSLYGIGMILPANGVKGLCALVKEKKIDVINIAFFKYGFKFSVGSAVLTSQLVDGKFPDFTRFIPQNSKGSTSFDPKELVTPLKEAKILAKIGRHGKFLPVVISCHKKLHWTGADKNKEWPLSSVVTTEAAPNGVGFNLKYLSELCVGEMFYGGASDPIKVEGVDRVGVLMPVRFSN